MVSGIVLLMVSDGCVVDGISGCCWWYPMVVLLVVSDGCVVDGIGGCCWWCPMVAL